MKKLLLPVIVMLFILSCQREPPSALTGQTGTDSLPTTTEDTATWHKSNPGIGAIMNFYFLNPEKGFCAAGKGIYSTLDSGKTWTPIDTSDAGEDIFFLDQQYGYFITGTGFGRTTDGGATWQVEQNKFYVQQNRRVYFVTNDIGYITAYPGLFKTTDGGVTWKLINNEMQYDGIYFVNEQNGWISGHSQGLFQTEDGGTTLKSINSDSARNLIYTVCFADAMHGWASGTTNYIMRTIDGGNTWNKVIIGKVSSEIQFLNTSVGYTATLDGISKSTDGGDTWNQILKSDGAQLEEVFFINENFGWAGDSKGNIYRLSK